MTDLPRSDLASFSILGGQGAGSQWTVDSWRLTGFLSGQSPDTRWWARVVGEEPDVQNSNPRQGIFQESGHYGTGTLTVSLQPGRVDILYASRGPETSEDDVREAEAHGLGEVADSLKSFRTIVTRWLEICPPLNRLAVGVVLQRPATNRQDAYRIIMDTVPGLRLDSPDCSDVIYQINRPRLSNVLKEQKINRLSKWSAAALQILKFELAPSQQTIRQVAEPTLSARLELDVNTAPTTNADFESIQLESIVNELVGLALEIAERGDIP